jgi:hypothetical protein
MSDPVEGSERIGVLVIHGMGEQAPYQTLDGFARGLASALRTDHRPYSIEFNPINRQEGGDLWTEARVELVPGVSASGESKAQPRITVAEYYWSPKAEDKMSWQDTLKWLAASDLSPISHMAANVQEIWDAYSTASWKQAKALRDVLWILLREVLRILILYIPLLLIIYALLQSLGAGVSELFPAAKAYQDAIDQSLTVRNVLIGSLGIVILSLASFLYTKIVPNAWRKLCTLWVWFRNKLHKKLTDSSRVGFAALVGKPKAPSLRSQNDMARKVRRYCIGIASVLLLAFAIPFYYLCEHYECLIQWYWKLYVLHWNFIDLWNKIEPHHLILWNDKFAYLQAAAGAVIAIVLRNFFANYMGKVAIYVTSDANSKNYAIRSAILQGSCAALNNFLDTGDEKNQYDRVYIAAHSLGTAIALDTVNELLIRAQADTSGDLQKKLQRLRGLLTFGSPLNKIWYFFRQQTEADEAIRAQILSKLHAFRRVSSLRDYDPYEMLPKTDRSMGPENPELIKGEIWKFRWINVIAKLDIFTGPLRFNPDVRTVTADPPTDGSLTLRPSKEGFYWVDRQYKGALTRYWKPVLAHNTYWDDPCLYDRFLADFGI